MGIYRPLLQKAINVGAYTEPEMCGSVDANGTVVVVDGSFGKENCVRVNLAHPMSLTVYKGESCNCYWAYSVALEEGLSLDNPDELVAKYMGEVGVESASFNICDSIMWDALSSEDAQKLAWYGTIPSRFDTESYFHTRTGADMSLDVFAVLKDNKVVGVLIDGTLDEDLEEYIAEFEEPVEEAEEKRPVTDDLDDFLQTLSETELWELAEKVFNLLRTA